MFDIKDLKPQYDFTAPNQDVILAYNELIDLTLPDSTIISGVGQAVLSFKKKPKVIFKIAVTPKDNVSVVSSFMDKRKVTVYLTERNIDIAKMYISDINTCFEDGTPYVVCQSLQEPFITLGSDDTNVDCLVFHLFNFVQFSSEQRARLTKENGFTLLNVMQLKWRGWVIEIKEHQKTSEHLQEVRNNGGFTFSHVGMIKKQNNSLFSISELQQVRNGLCKLFNFAVGRNCWINLCVGYNESQKVYEDFGTVFSEHPSIGTWFHGTSISVPQAKLLEELFPLFMDKYVDDNFSNALGQSISWYINSTKPGQPLMDMCIILICAGIEKLTYEYIVLYKNLKTRNQFNSLRASDKFRCLFEELNIPIAIPENLSHINRYSQEVSWDDIPHALTEMRNSIIHPIHRCNEQTETRPYYESWKLALEYFELCILGICGYQEQYKSRTQKKLIKVPWAEQ